MIVDSLSDLRAFADECATDALESAEDANLVMFSESAVKLRRKSMNLSHLLVQHPDYEEQPLFYCEKAWGVVLSVDLRNSSTRAMDVGARDTFVTMHVYMRTMLRLVTKSGGTVIGLRGDGLLAVFGHRKVNDSLTDDDPEASQDAVRTAVQCGDAMLRTVNEVVNPILTKKGIRGDLVAGVGVDSGWLVVTKIGIQSAYDVTAYGPCVNNAAKASSMRENRDHVLLCKSANQAYPKRQGGKVQIVVFDKNHFKVTLPSSTLV